MLGEIAAVDEVIPVIPNAEPPRARHNGARLLLDLPGPERRENLDARHFDLRPLIDMGVYHHAAQD